MSIEKYKDCITFTDPAYVLYDEDAKAVITTEWGGLSTFSTRGAAEAMARSSRRRLTVIPVSITPLQLS